jgi:hypothetical protein
MTAPNTAASSTLHTATQSLATSAATSLASSIADLTLEGSNSDSDHASGRSTPPTSAESEPVVENKGYTGHGPFPYISDKMGYTKPKSFAQPIVFFDIKCLARFGTSPVAVNLTHLTIRVPSRDLAYVLVGPQTHARAVNVFPSLRYLDISTTNVRLDTALSTLLKSYSRLEHLILDRVNLFGFTAREKGSQLCKDLGGLCVSAGLTRAKERERLITSWEVAERTRWAQAEAERRRQQQQQHQQYQSSGDEDDEDEESEAHLAAVEEARAASAAAEERERAIALARSRRGHRSAAQSTFSLRDRPLRSRRLGASTSIAAPSIPLPPQEKLYFVLPHLPNLKTMSIGGEAHALSSKRVAEWEYEFHAGWREGLVKQLGWATHVAEKYERAKRKAEEWFAQEDTQANKTSKGHGKGKAKASGSATSATKVKPPCDIRIYRFASSSEPRVLADASDPTADLIEVELVGRDYLEPYKLAIADAELWTTSQGNAPPCVFCTVPDCEGPLRRGTEGEKVDGRGGMTGQHKPNCGHLVGRNTWGWNGQM